MSRGEEKAKWRWWRPRFTVRSLTIFVTLVCVYLAAWVPTNKYAAGIGIPEWRTGDGMRPPAKHGPQYSVALHADALLPLVLRQNDIDFDDTTHRFEPTRRYYLWLFGPKITLPFESKWNPRLPRPPTNPPPF